MSRSVIDSFIIYSTQRHRYFVIHVNDVLVCIVANRHRTIIGNPYNVFVSFFERFSRSRIQSASDEILPYRILRYLGLRAIQIVMDCIFTVSSFGQIPLIITMISARIIQVIITFAVLIVQILCRLTIADSGFYIDSNEFSREVRDCVIIFNIVRLVYIGYAVLCMGIIRKVVVRRICRCAILVLYNNIVVVGCVRFPGVRCLLQPVPVISALVNITKGNHVKQGLFNHFFITLI